MVSHDDLDHLTSVAVLRTEAEKIYPSECSYYAKIPILRDSAS